MSGHSCENRGTTLVEILIASTLFIIVSIALYFTLHTSQGQLKPADAKSQSLRSCLIAAEHLREELSAAWVGEPFAGESSTQLSYRVPKRDDQGLALTGPTGDLQWTLPRLIRLQDGKLMREDEQTTRIYSRLGAQGEIEFLRVSPTLLEVTISSHFEKKFSLSRSYQLKNQF